MVLTVVTTVVLRVYARNRLNPINVCHCVIAGHSLAFLVHELVPPCTANCIIGTTSTMFPVLVVSRDYRTRVRVERSTILLLYHTAAGDVMKTLGSEANPYS